MIRSLLILVPLLLAGPRSPKQPEAAPDGAAEPTGKPAKRQGMMLGAAALNGGSPIVAVRMYERQVKMSPDAPAPNVALGRAYAKAGRCEDALSQLWPWIGSTPFGARAALAAASCATRLGLYGDAVAFDMIALEDRPNNVRALTNLASDLYLLGDRVSAEEVIERLAYGLAGPFDRSAFARAGDAARRGDTDEFDTIVALMEREGRGSDELRRMSAQLWLDLGDPVSALASLGVKPTVTQRVIRSEILRRMGYAEDARLIINQRIKGRSESLLADCVRARIMVDVGEFDEARELLDSWPDSDSGDLIAAEWYYSRAMKDEPGTARWAAAYALVQDNKIRTLEQQIPVHREATPG